MSPRLLPNTPLPVQVWGEQLEAEAERQLRHLSTLPILFHHVAVMPDVHWGLGATVGTVLATEGAVIPAAVGVDIGCGVQAVRLPLAAAWLEQDQRRAELRRRIEQEIPVGFQQYTAGEVSAAVRDWAAEHLGPGAVRAKLERPLWDKALHQLGTLGEGNHFIEVSHDELGRLWVLLHSGSRHIGKVLADSYIRAAKSGMRARNLLAGLPDANLAWLDPDDPLCDDYLHDVSWAQDYAACNRREMMRRILALVAALAEEVGTPIAPRALAADRVDCHHNYVAREEHFGRRVLVTRKGAVSAKVGERGIIPGSMGACSYIVRGRGNAESYHSCAHGAGRAMSRKAAKKRFTVGDLARQTAGVECRKDAGVLDEIPQAYKNIDEVMAAQADLVSIEHTLKQLLCVKG